MFQIFLGWVSLCSAPPAAGITFAGLFLQASGALSYVSFAGGSPSLTSSNPGFSLNYLVV